MPIINPKVHTMCFRLSEDEYRSVCEAALRNNARSVSDYMRDILMRAAQPPITPGNGRDSSVTRLLTELESLETQAHRLRAILASGARPPE